MDFLETQAISARRRILSVWFPLLPIDRLKRRRSSELADAPLVVSIKETNAWRIHALDARASRLGLCIGQAMADARAMVPDIEAVEADEAADAALLEGIAEWCDRYTPYVAFDAPYGLFLDLTGVAHLFGGERRMMETVKVGFAKQGFHAKLGLAGTSGAASALSRYAVQALAEPGKESEAVAPLPVAAIRCEPRVLHALKRAGLTTIGQVAARQRGELASRFGKLFVRQLEGVLGRHDQPISPRRPVPDLIVEHAFADPVVMLDVIIATLDALANHLSEVLEEKGEGARLLEAVFYRADGTVRRLSIETAAPTRDPAVMVRLLRTKLDALPDPMDPGFGFDLIRLEAILSQANTPEAVALGRDDRTEREISFLIDQLSARFGGIRVLRYFAQDTHVPEGAAVLVPAQSHLNPEAKFEPKRSVSEMPQRPVRLLPRPEPISVMAQFPDGPPLRFRWRRVLHTAVRAAGPESIAMDWWRNPRPTRDYYRVEDELGRRFWLYREGEYCNGEPVWFMHGMFA